jgi:hypothetical protein
VLVGRVCVWGGGVGAGAARGGWWANGGRVVVGRRGGNWHVLARASTCWMCWRSFATGGTTQSSAVEVGMACGEWHVAVRNRESGQSRRCSSRSNNESMRRERWHCPKMMAASPNRGWLRGPRRDGEADENLVCGGVLYKLFSRATIQKQKKEVVDGEDEGGWVRVPAGAQESEPSDDCRHTSAMDGRQNR